MKRMGITAKELREAKEGSITDLKIAIAIVGYSLNYQDDDILLKIKPSLVREALIGHVSQMEIK